MWKLGLAVIALPLALFALLAGCGGEDRPLLVDHPGHSVYRKYCRRCHGDSGDGIKASRMAKRPIDLASPAYRDTVDLDAVRRVVLEGKGRMAGYAEKLRADQAGEVSAYVLGMAAARAEREAAGSR